MVMRETPAAISLHETAVLVRDRLARYMTNLAPLVDGDGSNPAGVQSDPGGAQSFEDELYYIKTWYLDDPLAFNYQGTPLAVVLIDNPRRTPLYVQLDNETLPITIACYIAPIRRVRRASDGHDLAGEATGKLWSMYDRISRVIRADPTLGHHFYDCEVTGAVDRKPGFIGRQSYYSTDVKLLAKRRVPWVSDGIDLQPGG